MSNDTYNDAFFPVEKFYEEAIRWAVDNAPSRILGEGTTLPTEGIKKEGMFNDVVVLDISQHSFGRLLRFMLKGWKTKPLIIYDTDARYAQMANPVLRGKPSHPIVAICDNKTRLEAYLLAKPNGMSAMKRIHRFLEEAISPEPLCVHAFLDKLRDLGYKIEYSENGGEDSVKVLTMHSSKGLEYPIVILDNLSAPFRGGDYEEVYVEERYGLAPRAFDSERMLKADTLLRRLHEIKEGESSLADALNLYYVALTRAKYGLHMLFKEETPMPDVKYARSFAEFTDFNVWRTYIEEDHFFNVPKQDRDALVFRPDEALAKQIMDAFLWQYPYKGYENLPVKSSATGLMDAQFVPETKPDFFKELTDDEQADLIEAKGTEKDETGKERGIAYHSFLERVDFGRLHVNGRRINTDELSALVDETYAKMQAQNVDGIQWLDKRKCLEILSNDVFYQFQDAHLQKEQRFLVSLPIKDTYVKYREEYHSLGNCADEMLFQGAIDLLAVGKNKAIIVDYK
jgi:ATP-dependent exoDNAse (exonuclease V) beta subunit